MSIAAAKQKTLKQEWDEAVDFWNDPRVEDPVFYEEKSKAPKEMQDEVAWINMRERRAYFNMPNLKERFGRENFKPTAGHEIGHDAFCPYDLKMCLMLTHAADKVVRNAEAAKYLENLFADTLVNTRHIHKGDPSIINIYQRMAQRKPEGKVFNTYLSMCEKLWNMPQGSLAPQASEEMQADAEKLEDIIKKSIYSDNPQKDWPDAMTAFAKVMKKHKDQDKQDQSSQAQSQKGKGQGQGGQPSPGSGEKKKASDDPNGVIDYHSPKDFSPVDPAKADDRGVASELAKAVRGVARKMSPQQYKRLMSSTGILNQRKAITWFYRDLAHQFDVRLPYARANSGGGSPSAIKRWKINDSFKELDVPLSLEYGIMIPGETTLKRVRDYVSTNVGLGGHPDIAICLDCSGSMPDPSKYLSVPTLSAMVVAHAAIRSESKVAVTLFSHVYDVLGYTKDKDLVDEKLTDFPGGGTVIPAEQIYNTVHSNPNPQHVLIISDTQISNINSRSLSYLQDALQKGNAGGTVFLTNKAPGFSKQLEKIGYNVITMTGKNNLLGLSFELSSSLYGG